LYVYAKEAPLLTLWPGTIKLLEDDEDKIKEERGSITIPEVAHDTEEDEYVVCFP
jgi:hypothetical protein